MATLATATERPASPEEAAALLRALGEDGRVVRVRGGATKLHWGGVGEPVAVELETAGLDAIVEHNVGDFTAVLQAGVPLARAQDAFRAEGQMLALDPPLTNPDEAGDTAGHGATAHPGATAHTEGTGATAHGGASATVGGVVATADSGPLRHRYGGVRDLIVGVTVALSDGTLAKAGGKVIKNVAGYDLGKLFAGSFGTLGLIVQVAVRLHPSPETSATVTGASDDPEVLGAAARALAASPLEADCLDARWEGGAGALLVRFGGAAAARQAEATVARVRAAGLDDVRLIEDDDELWTRQRVHQRSATGAVLKVSGRPGELAAACRAAEQADGRLVGRAALGLSWIVLEGDDLAKRSERVRTVLGARACVLLDGPPALRAAVDPWGAAPDAGALALMARVKERFDPARIFRPGAFLGGI